MLIPVSTILSRVRTRYESATGGSSTRWSDSLLTDFVNEAIENIAESTLFYERYTSVPFQPNRQFYDLRGFTPETVVRIKSIYNTGNNLWLEPLNPDKLHLDWRQSTGNPQGFFTRGIYWFAIYPKSTAALTTNRNTQNYLRVYFAGIPSRFSNTQEVLRDLPNDMIPAIEDYCLYEMAAIDRRHDMALYYWDQYYQREERFRRFVDNRVGWGRIGI